MDPQVNRGVDLECLNTSSKKSEKAARTSLSQCAPEEANKDVKLPVYRGREGGKEK